MKSLLDRMEFPSSHLRYMTMRRPMSDTFTMVAKYGDIGTNTRRAFKIQCRKSVSTLQIEQHSFIQSFIHSRANVQNYHKDVPSVSSTYTTHIVGYVSYVHFQPMLFYSNLLLWSFISNIWL